MPIQNVTPYNLFEVLSEEELNQVIGISTFKLYRKYTHIIRKDEPITSLYYINQGSVKVTKNIGPRSDDFAIIYNPESYFGEINFFTKETYFFDTIALEDTQLLILDYKHLRAIMLLHKELGHKLLWCICRNLSAQLRVTNNRIEQIFDFNPKDLGICEIIK